MKNKAYAALALLSAATGVLLIVGSQAQTDQRQAVKLSGSWVGQTAEGAVRWSLTYAPSDPSGRTAGFQNHLVPSAAYAGWLNDFLLESCGISPAASFDVEVGETFMTGNNTARYTGVWHGFDEDGTLASIFVDSSLIEFSSPTELTISHTISVYDASADLGNGLPDPNAAPVCCLPGIISTASRVQLASSCIPSAGE